MTTCLRSISLAICVVAMGGCAQSTGHGSLAQQETLGDASDCFFLSGVTGFNDAPDSERGSDRIFVHTGPSETYLFETFGSCPDLNFSEAIGFDQTGPGRICRGIDVDLVVPTSIGAQRCAVRMISKVPDEQSAAR